MDKAQSSLQKRLKEAEKSVRLLNKIKAGKKTFEAKSADIDTRLEAIRTDLQTLDSNLSSLDQSVKLELVALVALVEKSGNTLLGFQDQVAEKIDRTEAEKLLGKQKQALLATIEAMGLRLEKQIVLNRQKIAAVKEKTGGKKPTGKATSAPKKTQTTKTAPKQAEKTAPAAKQAPEKPAQPGPKPGEIVEQDL